MLFTMLIPASLALLTSFASASPIAAADATKKLDISVNVYSDTACSVPDVEGYSLKANKVCQQFITQEYSVSATSVGRTPKSGCVVQLFADTACKDVYAAFEPNGNCAAPILGPVSSGWLVDC